MGKWVCFWTAPTADPRPLRVPVNEDLQSPRWAGRDCDPCFKAGMMQRSQVVCSTPHTTTNCRTGLELNLFYSLPSPLSPLPSPYSFMITSLAITDAGLKAAATAGRLIIGKLPTLLIQYKTTLTVIFDRKYKKWGTPSLLPTNNSDLPSGRTRYKTSNFCMLSQIIWFIF